MDDNTDIGPNSHLRPKAVIREGAHIGNFVEIKKAEIGVDTLITTLPSMTVSLPIFTSLSI